jgi:hypothetical protein
MELFVVKKGNEVVEDHPLQANKFDEKLGAKMARDKLNETFIVRNKDGEITDHGPHYVARGADHWRGAS